MNDRKLRPAARAYARRRPSTHERTPRGQIHSALLLVRPWVALATCLFAVGLARTASAQLAFVAPPRGYMEWTYTVDVPIDQQFSASIDAGGSFQLFQAGIGGGAEGALNQKIGVGLDVSYLYSGYDFAEATPPSCGPTAVCFDASPFKSIHTISMAPSAALILSPTVQLIAWVPLRFDTETSANANGFTGGIIAGLRIVAFDDRFETTLGVGYQSQIEDDGRVFPLIAMNWQLMDNLALRTEGEPYEGGMVALLWGSDQTVQLRIAGGWERNRFRLSRKGTRNPSGIGQHEVAPIEIGMALNLARSMVFEIHGGVGVAGRLTIDDALGNQVAQSSYGAAARLGGSFRVSF